MLSTVLLIVLILLLVGAIPSWPHSRSWGYGPSGILGIVLVVVLVLALTGRVYDDVTARAYAAARVKRPSSPSRRRRAA